MKSTRLEIAGISATIDRLVRRIDERFPERSIGNVARELSEVAHRSAQRLDAMVRPRWWLRMSVGLIVLTGVGLGVWALLAARSDTTIEGADEWLSVAESAFQDLVFAGAAAVFLFTIEGRLRRRDALRDLHQLRSLAHVIDMHQLTKDPEVLIDGYTPTPSSPERTMGSRELSRYLDYCSELLSLTSKLAALYSQQIRDPVVLDAVREIQDLTVGLSAKIWQKISIVDARYEATASSHT